MISRNENSNSQTKLQHKKGQLHSDLILFDLIFWILNSNDVSFLSKVTCIIQEPKEKNYTVNNIKDPFFLKPYLSIHEVT